MENKVKPITPKQAEKKQHELKDIPDFIFEAFNQKIAESYDKGTAIVYQNDIMNMVADNDDDSKPNRDEVFANHWLDVEEHYRKAGWEVTYHKTPYYSTDSCWFEFKRNVK